MTLSRQGSGQGIEDVRQLLASLPDRHRMSIDERRAGLDAMGARAQLPDALICEKTALVHCPATRLSLHASDVDAPNVLYLHGGAYVAGSPRSHLGLGITLAIQTNANVYLLDYRLAPEHVFPAAFDDAVAAYAKLCEASGGCAIVGDSAGGGLGAATAVQSHRLGLRAPVALVLLSPWLDLSCSLASHQNKAAADPFLSTAGLKQDAAAYLGASPPDDWRASPLFADLTRLPPTLVQVGSEEILLDDAREFVRRTARAGVEVELEIWQDMVHVWHAFRGMLPDAEAALSHIAKFIRRQFDVGKTHCRT